MRVFDIIIISLGSIAFIALACINPVFAPLNTRVRRFIDQHRSVKLRPLMILTHRYNDVLSLSLQVLIIAFLIGWLGEDVLLAIGLTAIMFVQTTVVSLIKRLTAITRPPQQFTHVIMQSSSYPSGHAAASMTFAFLIPMALTSYLTSGLILLIQVYLVAVAFITAYGRLYLDVHWLTDILGGWLLSLVVVGVSRLFLISML